MQYTHYAVPLILLGYIITMTTCESSYPQQHVGNSLLRPSGTDSDTVDANSLDKRAERYSFGLGRRGYTYTSGGAGIKRLPIYNFGLGKRTR